MFSIAEGDVYCNKIDIAPFRNIRRESARGGNAPSNPCQTQPVSPDRLSPPKTTWKWTFFGHIFDAKLL